MKHLFFILLSFSLLTSCESENDKANATNEKFSRELVANFDKDVQNVFDNRTYDLEDDLARLLYDKAKRNNRFIGLSIRPWGVSYCTSNTYNCSFHGEGDPIWEDKKEKIEVWYGDLHFNDPPDESDTLTLPGSSSTGTGTEGNYQNKISDVLMMSYRDGEVILYFKAKQKLTEKFQNSESWRGSPVGSINVILLDR